MRRSHHCSTGRKIVSATITAQKTQLPITGITAAPDDLPTYLVGKLEFGVLRWR
jgi:hypothetical protein